MAAPRYAFLSLLAAGAIVSTGGCQRKEATLEKPVQNVRAGLVETIHTDAPVLYTATFSPLNDINLAFKTPGLIESILQVRGADGKMRDVQPGDKVAKDAELAVVRRLDYQQKLDSAREQLRQAQAQLGEAQAALDHAELDYTRSNNLYQKSSLIKPEYDRAKAQLDSSRAQVAAANAAIANATVGVSEADLSLGDTSLKAPFSGWVTARNVDRGSMVSSAVVGFSLLDSHIVKGNFAISDTDLRNVRRDQRITVRVDALQRAVTGLVNTISPQADSKTHVFTIEVYVDNPNEDIRPGMLGSVALSSAPASTAHVVAPLSAVVRDPANANGFGIYRLDGQEARTHARFRIVTLGDTFGNSIEIKSGAVPGDRIVVLGAELLRDGEEVWASP
jgi:RND family efflux transporter MFP subunit